MESSTNHGWIKGLTIAVAFLVLSMVYTMSSPAASATATCVTRAVARKIAPVEPAAVELGTPDITSGLLLHYTFDADDGTNVLDSSGSGFDGTAHGTTVTSNTVRGLARCFDGTNDYIGVPHDPGYKPTDAVTVSVWINMASKVGSRVAVGCMENSGWSIAYLGSSDRIFICNLFN